MPPTQITRRTFSLLVISGVLAACGETTNDATSPSTTPDSNPSSPVGNDASSAPLVGIQVPDREPAESVPDGAGNGVTAFGLDLFADLVSTIGARENVSYSPLSVAVALAMVEPGTVNEAQTQLRNLLSLRLNLGGS